MKETLFERFTRSIFNHQMTISLDNGLHRHLTFKKPQTGDMHYHINTWPGYLSISGDMGCFVFSRVQDMFTFFRGKPNEVNPDYWSEKLQAPKYNDKSVRDWSSSLVRSAVHAHIKDWISAAKADGLEKEFIAEEKEKSLELIRLADEEFEFASAIYSFDTEDNGINFSDFFLDVTTTEFTYHYLWCCYAIVHAINVYDQFKSSQEEA